MKHETKKSFNLMKQWCSVVVILVVGMINAHSQSTVSALEELRGNKVSPNDVSILYPLPTSQEDLAALISMADLHSTADNTPVFPVADFTNILFVAKSHGKVSSRAIAFVKEIESFDVWKIAGIRFDTSAPGGSSDIQNAFGSIPQIRLVLQPVTVKGNEVIVHDVTIHVIYNYVVPNTPGSLPPRLPDNEKVIDIISGLLDLQKACEENGSDTSVSLGVHPCLQQPGSDFHPQVVNFLQSHLHAAKFEAAAIMGLNNGAFEPWIFVALQRQGDGQFHAFPSPGLGPITATSVPPFAQMISFLDTPRVQPQTSTTNTLAISADFGIPVAERRGVSTAVLFGSVDLEDPAILGEDGSGNSVSSDTLKNKDIVDWVANPEKSHFFNTDCISCHTETTRREALSIPPSEFRFIPRDAEMTANEDFMHKDKWNVRNFGWFVNPFSGDKQTTITLRTANETFEVVEAINEMLMEHN